MPNRIDLLQIFLAAAEAASFREAAVRRAVSPQVVSRAVRDLEAELGELLFHRSTRRVQLTDLQLRLLAALNRRQEMTCAREVLAREVWGRPVPVHRLETLVSRASKSLASVRDSAPFVTSVRRLSEGVRDWPTPARHSSRPVPERRRFHWPFRRSSDDA